MNTRYVDLARERSVFETLRRYLEETYLDGGGTPKQVIWCEAVTYELRQVPNSTIADVIQRLEAEEDRLTQELAKYDFRPREDVPLGGLPPKPVEENTDERT